MTFIKRTLNIVYELTRSVFWFYWSTTVEIFHYIKTGEHKDYEDIRKR